MTGWTQGEWLNGQLIYTVAAVPNGVMSNVVNAFQLPSANARETSFESLSTDEMEGNLSNSTPVWNPRRKLNPTSELRETGKRCNNIVMDSLTVMTT